jgi:hypothetical protein
MPHLPKLFAATLVISLALIAGQAKAASLPVTSGLATQAGASLALPVEKVHRRYRYWGWGPRYNYWYGGPQYYYRPYYYGYGYRPYYGYRYWGRPYYRYWVVSREA